jgi:hypothetical protein
MSSIDPDDDFMNDGAAVPIIEFVVVGLALWLVGFAVASWLFGWF